LIKQGHRVVLHARNEERGKQALQQAPGAENVLIADLANMHETKELASKANALGAFDAVIHNAGVYQVPRNSVTVDGLPLLLAVNTLAPYILTCLMHRPKRLIYMSSGMHLSGDPNPEIVSSGGHVTYSDTKLHDVILAMAVARKWPDVYANAVNPGWVPTKMGGAGAPDNLEQGYQTQVWLAVSNDPAACVSGHYFHHKQQSRFQQAAKDTAVQEKFLAMCEKVSGVGFDSASQRTLIF
ncbi:MAG TPA: SDR family NAD(P)-dependent oxidoreductase, partial [Mucilaginibacter sp.]|nr:SDR family NAD(P)-dependent oxidoreductase [Mucilaginibacter sp.]